MECEFSCLVVFIYGFHQILIMPDQSADYFIDILHYLDDYADEYFF